MMSSSEKLSFGWLGKVHRGFRSSLDCRLALAAVCLKQSMGRAPCRSIISIYEPTTGVCFAVIVQSCQLIIGNQSCSMFFPQTRAMLILCSGKETVKQTSNYFITSSS